MKATALTITAEPSPDIILPPRQRMVLQKDGDAWTHFTLCDSALILMRNQVTLRIPLELLADAARKVLPMPEAITPVK